MRNLNNKQCLFVKLRLHYWRVDVNICAIGGLFFAQMPKWTRLRVTKQKVLAGGYHWLLAASSP